MPEFYELGKREARGDPEEGGCIAFVGWDEETVEEIERFGHDSLLHNAYDYCDDRARSDACQKHLAPLLEKECSERNLWGSPTRSYECFWVQEQYTDQWVMGCAEYIEEEIIRELG